MNNEKLFRDIHDVYNSMEYREWCYEYHFVPFHVTSLMTYLKNKGEDFTNGIKE